MKFYLAPLAGFTSAPFRLLCQRRGANLTYTEMVSAAGLAHGSSPTRHLMEMLPDEGPVACQLFGRNPDELAFAAAEVEKLHRFVAIDLNAGCPMPKIVHEGCGAALIQTPQLVHDCLVAIKRETTLPVTLKTRPGTSADKVMMLELLDAAETAGCSGITLHGRFARDMHGGPVHYDLLAELVQRSHIPVTGNGGVYNHTTARRMAQTGVDAIMIGRAALANPWIFSDIISNDPAEVVENPSRRAQLQDLAYAEHLSLLLQFRDQLERTFPNDHIPSPDGYFSIALHTQLFRYFNGRPGSAELRRRLNTINTISDAQSAIDQIKNVECRM